MAGKKYRSGVLAGASVVAVAAMSGTSASAKAATLFSTGFEASNVSPASFTSTGYAPGAYLTNQPVGSSPLFTSSVTADVAANASIASAVVASYSTTGFSGAPASNQQYVQINDAAGISTSTFASYFPNLGSISPVAAGTPVVDVVGTIGVSGGTNGDAFGLIAFDGTSSQNEVASVLVNAATGAVTASNGTVTTTGAAATTPVTFESYELQLNYSSGTYNVYEAGAGATVFTNEIAANVPFETAATTFSTGGFYTESLATSGTATGLGLVDNLSISTAVPEPASASLIVGGLMVAGGRRRRRSARQK